MFFQVCHISIVLSERYIKSKTCAAGNLEGFWEHEWLKHGTCAAQIPELNSELLYFRRTLSWLQEYNMSTILSRANILPDGNSIKAIDVFNAVFNALHTRPIIECIQDQQGVSYLSGIRTCYSKELKLVDCAGEPTTLTAEQNSNVDSLYILNCGQNDEFIRLPSVLPIVYQNTTKI